MKKILDELEQRGLYPNYLNKIVAFLYEHAAYELRTSQNEEQSRKFYDDLRCFCREHEHEVFLSSPAYVYFQDNLFKHEYDSGWFRLIGDFRAQLELRADDLVEMLRGYQRIVLWGMGKRGEAFQDFCKRKEISLAGITDRSNRNVGDTTKYGVRIMDKKDALKIADMIVASNWEIYESLQTQYRGIQCIDLGLHCPY